MPAFIHQNIQVTKSIEHIVYYASPVRLTSYVQFREGSGAAGRGYCLPHLFAGGGKYVGKRHPCPFRGKDSGNRGSYASRGAGHQGRLSFQPQTTPLRPAAKTSFRLPDLNPARSRVT